MTNFRYHIMKDLPSLPHNLRWHIRYKRAWCSLVLQRKTWYGWKTLHKMELNPKGMGIKAAILSAADDIMELGIFGAA